MASALIKEEDMRRDESDRFSTYFSPISTIRRENKSVCVKGRVLYTSGVCSYDNNKGRGLRMCFDVGDETGTIRVVSWDSTAVTAGQIIRTDQTVELRNVGVYPRNRIFNNLDHPCQLKLHDNFTPLITILENHSVQVLKQEVNYVRFADVKNFEEYQYFDVSGTIKRFYRDFNGVGAENGNDFEGQTFELEDQEKNILKVTVWNNYIETSEEMRGKRMDIERCRYSLKYDSINPTGAYITIDGTRII